MAPPQFGQLTTRSKSNKTNNYDFLLMFEDIGFLGKRKYSQEE